MGKRLSSKREPKQNPYLQKLLILIYLGLTLFLSMADKTILRAEALTFPSRNWGFSFGNSKNFMGVRFNFRDKNVEKIYGINITLWKPYRENKAAEVTGLSLGILPGAAELKGLNIGFLGTGALRNAVGLNFGLLGAGSGQNLYGFNFGGIGVGACLLYTSPSPRD